MTMNDQIPEPLRGRLAVSVPDAGQALGLGRDASYAAAARGEIPTLRLGRRLVVPVPRLLELLGLPQTNGETGPASPAVATLEPVEGAQTHGDTPALRLA